MNDWISESRTEFESVACCLWSITVCRFYVKSRLLFTVLERGIDGVCVCIAHPYILLIISNAGMHSDFSKEEPAQKD